MKRKILFIASLLFGLMFLNSGLNKFFNYMPPPEDMPEAAQSMFSAMVEIGWLLPLIAIVEIIGGILFMIPKYRALGSLILAPIMVGILLANLSVAPEGLFVSLPMLAIYLWAVLTDWHKFKPLFGD